MTREPLRLLIHTPYRPMAELMSGGAQRWFDGLLDALTLLPVDVTVVCPEGHGDKLKPEHGSRRVFEGLVSIDDDHPVPHEITRSLALLHRLERDADVVLTIDRAYPLRPPIPVVLCLNNFSYPGECQAVFGLNWDMIVVPSDYLRRCLDLCVGPHNWQGQAPSIRVVPCALSPPGRDTNPEELAAELGLSDRRRYLAFPHRPSSGKGFATAVDAVAELHTRGEDHVLLVPTPDPELCPYHERAFLRFCDDYVRERGVIDLVKFHRWIRRDEMPAYLQLSEWSLCLSELAEGFGMTAMEAVAAGVPVIATPAGAMAETLPADHGVEWVEFRDSTAVADLVAGRGPEPAALARGRSYIGRHYRWPAPAAMLLDLLRRVSKRTGRFAPAPRADDAGAPWLRRQPSGRVWHDYRRDYV